MKSKNAALRATMALGAAITLAVIPLPGCDEGRKRECDALLGVMKPLDQAAPTVETIDGVIKQVDALKFQDQPLGVYAKNYEKTLTVLAATLRLKASSSPPDGTDDVIKKNLKDARTDRDDVQRLCSK
jgi:hypothetical protein